MHTIRVLTGALLLPLLGIWLLPHVSTGQESAVIPIREHTEAVLFPNRMYWQGPVKGTFPELGVIFESAHRLAVPALYSTAEGQAAALSIPGVLDDPSANAESARMAYSILRSMASEQSNRELAIFYEAMTAELPAETKASASLERFAAGLRDRVGNQALLIVIVGSNATSGRDGRRWSLAQERAYAPARRLQELLGDIPHRIHAVAGVNGMYSNPVADTLVEEHNQYTRITPLLIPREHLRAMASQPPPATVQVATSQATYWESASVQPRTSSGAVTPTVTWHQGMESKEMTELPKTLENSVGMTFAYIPAGSFIMGSPETELSRSRGEHQHHVTLTRSFYMQTTEVTHQQWYNVMGGAPAHFENWGWDYPVENVSWIEAKEFIDKLNQLEGTTLYRLPKEAEWEYACRAGTTTAFYNTTMQPGEKGENDELARYAWYFHNSKNRTQRVAQKEPNAWGLYDMHGNVWEWCDDWRGEYAFEPIVDPVGPPLGNAKIRRGGSFSHFPGFARSANRSWHHYKERSPDLGFRVLRDIGTITPQKATAAPAPMVAATLCEYRTEANGQVLLRKGIPDSRVTGTVYVERETPTMVVANEPYEYTLRVHNATGCDLYSVTVTEVLPDGFVLREARRKPDQQAGNTLRWLIQPMPAGSSQTFVIAGMATGARELQYCATVDFTLQSCGTTQVVQPRLTLTQETPESALLCDSIPVRFTVTNSGTGTAADTQLRITLPAGLTTLDGRAQTLAIGDLPAGASRDINLIVQAAESGTYRILGDVTARGNLQASANRTVTVSAPRLQVGASGRAEQYAGRPILYEISVTNTGNAAASNVNITASIPAQMQLVKASDNGMEQQGKVTWLIPTLDPQQTIKLSYTCHTSTPGTYTTRISATGSCAPEAAAVVATTVHGIAAILLELIDERDPLEVGETGTYVITATNQGSKASTNVAIICELEPNVELVNGTGATETTAATRGNRVVFAPLPTLAPGARAVWRVTVRALTPGDTRFKTILNTDQLERPVEATEATTVY